MSLNWKEINLILSELDLPGCQIQGVVQSAYEALILQLYGRGEAKNLLISLAASSSRLHETFRPPVKSDKPLRFAEFLKSRLLNGRIEEAVQLGDNRIVRILVRRGERRYRLYARLWSNAANLIAADEDGVILDAMRRLPKRGEVTGGRYAPEEEMAGPGEKPGRVYEVRSLEGPGSFNQKIDAWYAEHGGTLSLETLREEARRKAEAGMGRLRSSLEKLRAKEAEYEQAERLKEYGDLIMAHLAEIQSGASWLETENFYSGESVRIRLDERKSPAAMGEYYYDQYRKAKNGLSQVRAEIEAGEKELVKLEKTLADLLGESDPFRLQKLLRQKPSGGAPSSAAADRKRPGLSFRRKDWLIIVGRDTAENDALLRRHVKGNDLWLHVRDFPGSYVFIKQRSGKTVPLDILLDAGNLALFYSKGRNNGEGDLFYTPVKFLRRAKTASRSHGPSAKGPSGLVIPTQEKNLHIKMDEQRLRELEGCRIEK